MQSGCFSGMYNPKFIKEYIVSWWDYAKPEHKDKLIVADCRKSTNYLDSYIIVRQVMPREFFEKLAELNPFFLVRSTAIRDKVMTGEYPLAFFGLAKRAYQVRNKVKIKSTFPKEGVPVAPMTGGILKGGKHPSSAKLWVDFLYGMEGQMILIENEAILSLREGVTFPPAFLDYYPLPKDLNAINFDWDMLTEETRAKYRKEFNEIFSR
jgi:iron(III) transport system substrate-binding protein